MSAIANGGILYGAEPKVETIVNGDANIDVDNSLSVTSENPVQNKVVTEAINEINDNINGVTDSIADVDAKAIEATNIAKGRNQAHVFATTADMEAWLSNADNKGLWNKGDNIYIVELEVPDWWIAEVLEEADPDTGYYYKIGQLETQKVDLTNYVAKSDDVMIWRDYIEGDDWVTARGGIWHTKNKNDIYGIPSYSIIYKPNKSGFNGAYLHCYASNTNRGIYAWDSSTSKFVKLPRQDEIDAIVTAVNGKVTNSFTASRVLVSNSSGKVAASSSITTTELGYLDGVTSKIQTQLDKKMPISGGETTGQMQFIRTLGVTSLSYSQAGVSMIAPTNENSSTRAGIGFTNEGSNGAYLYLDIDGKLKFIDDQGVIKVITTTTQT